MTATLSRLSEACADVTDAGPDDVVSGVPARLVARPVSTAETAAVLAAAAGLGATVVPRGMGTALSWGCPPRSVDLLLDLSGLSTVLDHAAGDLVAVAQAGCPLDRLQEHLAPAGQRLALDPVGARGSVGGAIAANRSGPSRMLHGTVRDLLIGVTVVRADGVIATSGGRVVKNVAGYDLGKLLTGSLGTLAVITEATFRLHPLPGATSTLVVGLPAGAAGADADRLVRVLVHSPLAPAAVEVDWTSTGRRVAVRLEGTAAGVAARRDEAVELLRTAGATVVEEGEPSWWAQVPWDAGGVGLKLTSVLSGVAPVLDEVSAVTAELGVELAVRGSAGAGVLYAGLPAGTAAEVVTTVLTRLRAACASHGGSVVVLDAPPQVAAAVDVWGPVPALALMRAVKEQFDPDHRLSPGRFVGGI